MSNKEQQQPQEEATREEIEKIRKLIRQARGNKDGVIIDVSEDRSFFTLTTERYAVRANPSFKRDVFAKLATPPKWDRDLKAFLIPVEEANHIGFIAETARAVSRAHEELRDTWLLKISEEFVNDISINEAKELQNHLEYRKSHPEELDRLPPLPAQLYPPLICDYYANTKEGAFHNGAIISWAADNTFIAQYTGPGKLVKDDKGNVFREHFVTLHSTENFLHTAEDWADKKGAIARALGEWEHAEWKSIEYNGRAKANVYEYDTNIHSYKARTKALEHPKEEVASQTIAVPSPTVLPPPPVEALKEKKTKAPQRKKREAQSPAMSM